MNQSLNRRLGHFLQCLFMLENAAILPLAMVVIGSTAAAFRWEITLIFGTYIFALAWAMFFILIQSICFPTRLGAASRLSLAPLLEFGLFYKITDGSLTFAIYILFLTTFVAMCGGAGILAVLVWTKRKADFPLDLGWKGRVGVAIGLALLYFYAYVISLPFLKSLEWYPKDFFWFASVGSFLFQVGSLLWQWKLMAKWGPPPKEESTFFQNLGIALCILSVLAALFVLGFVKP